MKHKHHILPRHMGGTDDPDNIVELTIPEHAEAHRLLWEEHGNEYDRIAWLSLSRQMSLDSAQMEAKREGVRRFHTGRKRSPETIQRMREAQQKNVREGKWRGPSGGHSWSQEAKKRFSKTLTGAKRGPYKKSPCPNCGMMVAGNSMARWHGDKCTR